MKKSYRPNQNSDTSKLVIGRWLSLFICLLAFAANSLLCRMALTETNIDPLLFTNLRLISGGLMLLLLVPLLIHLTGSDKRLYPLPEAPIKASGRKGIRYLLRQWQGGFYLFLYMLGFSLAYQELATGTGALLLFGAVQMTMTLIGFYRREFPSIRQWLGWSLALSGLILLVFQSTDTGHENSSWLGTGWMVISGISWGLYTAYGQNHSSQKVNPTLRTRRYFVQASALIVITSLGLILVNPGLFAVFSSQLDLVSFGMWLAIVSGAITSALGYVLWYQVLPKLSTLEAASSQLIVPMIAAALGILLLSEPLTLSFLIASILAIGGLAMVIIPHK